MDEWERDMCRLGKGKVLIDQKKKKDREYSSIQGLPNFEVVNLKLNKLKFYFSLPKLKKKKI